MPSDPISEAGRQDHFEQWEKFGLGRVKADLLNGGHQLVGGPPAVQDLAWEWVRMKEAEEPKEVLTLKPGIWGMTIDLKELAQVVRRHFAKGIPPWAVACAVAFVTSGVTAAAMWWALKSPPTPVLVPIGIPQGAVIAMDDRAGCSKLGDGWEDAGFAGHFIIGASKTDDGPWRYGQVQDSDTVTLTAANIPATYYSSGHAYSAPGTAFDYIAAASDTKPTTDPNRVTLTGNATPSPIRIIPPYVVLHFCRKKA
jgi:hypothetical protein